jgi:hypothetical protein
MAVEVAASNLLSTAPPQPQRLDTASAPSQIDPNGLAPGASVFLGGSSTPHFTANDSRLEKACPICQAAPGGKCLEKVRDGSKYIDEPHKERYA